MIKRIIFWGATGQAKVLNEFIRKIGYNLVAIFDNNPEVKSPFPDVPIYYGIADFKAWQKRQGNLKTACLVAIGGAKGQERLKMQNFLEKNRIDPVIAIHPTAFVASDAQLSKGCQILAHATVCVQAKIGKACIINTNAVVDHESVLGNGVHIAPGAILAGGVSIGDYSLIGVGAVVLPRINIGRNVIIGAGAVVTRNIPDQKVVFGVPARIQHDNIHV